MRQKKTISAISGGRYHDAPGLLEEALRECRNVITNLPDIGGDENPLTTALVWDRRLAPAGTGCSRSVGYPSKRPGKISRDLCDPIALDEPARWTGYIPPGDHGDEGIL
jgi:hypothetical protein